MHISQYILNFDNHNNNNVIIWSFQLVAPADITYQNETTSNISKFKNIVAYT